MGQERASDHRGVTPCLRCAKFSGCGLLKFPDSEELDPRNIITVDEPEEVILDEDSGRVPPPEIRYRRSCAYFEEAHELETKFRGEFLSVGNTGDSALMALFHRALPVIDDARLFIDEEDDSVDVPDFERMLYDAEGSLRGLTQDERERQLRYQTDDDGVILPDKQGGDVPRGSLVLRKYVLSDEFRSKLTEMDISLSSVVRWKTDDLVQLILRHELDNGLIVRQRQAEGTGAPPKAKTTQATATKGKTKTMPQPIKLGTRPSPTKAPAAAAKPAAAGATKPKPAAARVAGKAAPSKAKETDEPPQPEETPEEGGGGSGEEIAALRAEVGELKELVTQLGNDVLKGITYDHDAVLQRINQAQSSIALGFFQVCSLLLPTPEVDGSLKGKEKKEAEEAAAATEAAVQNIYKQVLEGVPLDEKTGEPVMDAHNLISGQGEPRTVLFYDEVAAKGE